MLDESPRDVRFSVANAALRAALLMLRKVSAAELLLGLAVRMTSFLLALPPVAVAVATAVRSAVPPVSTVLLILLPLLRSESRCVLLAVLVKLRSVSAGEVTGRRSRTTVPDTSDWGLRSLLLAILLILAL